LGNKFWNGEVPAGVCSFSGIYPTPIHITKNQYKDVAFTGTGNAQFCGYPFGAAIRPTFVLRETVDNCMLFAQGKTKDVVYPHIHSLNSNRFLLNK
jgi:hypothetical protein